MNATLQAPSLPRSAAVPAADHRGAKQLLENWLNTQSINLTRHVASIRRFAPGEFGKGPAAPSEVHLDAANAFIDRYKDKLVDAARSVEAAVAIARREPTLRRLSLVLARKDALARRVLYVEGIWDFYFDLFVQRLSSYGERLRAVDRIAANCYEDFYVGMGAAKPTPRVLPFTYAQSGFGPLTYRRGVPILKLRRQANPFPLVIIPQHRLANVWALSSVLHEVSHNLQADRGLWELIPRVVFARLSGEGRLPESVANVWAGWHKEIMADMLALILGGPGAIESLMDVVGRSRRGTVRFSPLSVHPTPVLRIFINTILLRRLGLGMLAREIEVAWRKLYPQVTAADVPEPLLRTFKPAAELVIDAMIFTPYAELAGKTVAQTIPFGPAQMDTIEQGSRLLAEGKDAVAIPARFMIGAARHALDRRLASPQTITDNFYRMLGRR